jgi:GT2 family glycosyltransferase
MNKSSSTFHITAAIVTFNRLTFLKKLLTALKNQTYKPERIVVVNNSSTDGTAEFLKTCSNIEVLTQPNTGSSGGQFTSAEYCYERGSEWIWLMDDDVIPRADCLENLVKNLSTERIHVPLRLNPDGLVNQGDTLELNYTNPFKSVWRQIISPDIPKEEYIPAQGITFEGPLFHRSLINKIGLPEHDFFIYGDDTDYFSRAIKKGYKPYIVSHAISDRLLPVIEGNKFDWKSFYMIRNQIALDVLNGSLLVRYIRPFRTLLSWIIRVRNITEMKTVMKAFFNGYFYKSSDKNLKFLKDKNIKL